MNRKGDDYVAARLSASILRLTVEPFGAVPLPVLRTQALAFNGRTHVLRPDAARTRCSVGQCGIAGRLTRRAGGSPAAPAASVLGDKAIDKGWDVGFRASAPASTSPYVYEPGRFFSKHRDYWDTETVDGTVRMLVLTLPSGATGGELVIRNAGRDAVVDTPSNDPCDLCISAFYNDCVHRTEPVRTGYGFSLVYNVLADLSGRNAPSWAPDYTGQGVEISRIFSEWGNPTNGPIRSHGCWSTPTYRVTIGLAGVAFIVL